MRQTQSNLFSGDGFFSSLAADVPFYLDAFADCPSSDPNDVNQPPANSGVNWRLHGWGESVANVSGVEFGGTQRVTNESSSMVLSSMCNII